MNPLVSIVIPVYNGANYMREAIDSALAQTYENCEILVVNDGSNDGGITEEIALSYGDKIRYFAKKNGGVATALNMGIENMRGEYFSWLSHDDLYHVHKISRQIETLSAQEDKKTLITCGFACVDGEGRELSDSTCVDAKGREQSGDDAASYTDEQLGTPLFVFLKGILKGGLLFGCSLLVHKEHFARVGTFNVELLTNDIDLWFRMMRNQPLIYLREPLAIRRRHDGQDTVTKSALLVPAFHEFLLNVAKTLTDEEIIQVYGSRGKFYEELKYAGGEVTSYVNAKAAEEGLTLGGNTQTMEDLKAVILSNGALTSEQHEMALRALQAIQEQYEENSREIRQEYEASISWKITKPLRWAKKIWHTKRFS